MHASVPGGVPLTTNHVFTAAYGGAAADAEFAAFYRDTAGSLGGYVYRLVGDAEVAADVVQEAFVRLLTRWVTIRSPRPYLYHVATNLARDVWSERQRAERSMLSILGGRPRTAIDAVDLSVYDAVSRLPQRYREIVLLHYYADLPIEDVARTTRRPVGTVKRMLMEARERLARSLGGAS